MSVYNQIYLFPTLVCMFVYSRLMSMFKEASLLIAIHIQIDGNKNVRLEHN